MKFTVTMKHGDALHYALEGLADDEQEDARELALEWMEYGEYLRVEFDTVAGTATVVK